MHSTTSKYMRMHQNVSKQTMANANASENIRKLSESARRIETIMNQYQKNYFKTPLMHTDLYA